MDSAMTDQDTMPAVDLEGARRKLSTLREVYVGQLANFDCELEDEDAALAERLFEDVRSALSATPLSQAPAGQGVGVEGRLGMEALSAAFDKWRDDDALDEGWLLRTTIQAVLRYRAAMQAADAAQPTQDDAKRLREALERIRDQPDCSSTMGGRWIDWAKGRARQALTPTSKTGDTDHAPEQ